MIRFVRTIIILEGTIHRRVLPQSFLHVNILHDKLIERDRQWIDKILQHEQWLDDEVEWIENEDESFFPGHYGLVVLDVDNKRINYLYRGYLDRVYTHEFTNYFERFIDDIDYNNPDEFYPAVAHRMWDKKMIDVREQDRNGVGRVEEFDGDDFNSVRRQVDTRWLEAATENKAAPFFHVKWEEMGWEHIHFPSPDDGNGVEGYKKFFELVRERYL